MATFTQSVLLGSERLASVPEAPHAILEEAWSQFDWLCTKSTALLEASALTGMARIAGATVSEPLPAIAKAPGESRPYAPRRAVTVLRELLTDEWRGLLPEWMEVCRKRQMLIPAYYLPSLLERTTDKEERGLLKDIVGARGFWLAEANPEWNWVKMEELAPNAINWETGSPQERLQILRHLRASEPARATALLEKTWSEETPEFRAQSVASFGVGASVSDESLLTRALCDRRKDVRAAAQAVLAGLPGSAFAKRMKESAETLLAIPRGLLSKRVEINLPAAFDPKWKTDGIEEKPPAGIGEKAHWAQQILGLVAINHWVEKSGLDTESLIALAAKSSDWGDLVLGAWYRAALIHRDAGASAALMPVLRSRQKALPPGVNLHEALVSLLANCGESERWRLTALEPQTVWIALPYLSGVPTASEAKTFLDQVCPAIRDGTNPGGSPTAVLAARRLPPEYRDEAARRLQRENGLSKPAEVFLRALELRCELHAAFASSTNQLRL